MPGTLIERTRAQKPGRSSIPFPIAPHPRRQENLRKPDDKLPAADMEGDKPHFMAGTTSSSTRSITPTNKAHKRAPTPHALLALSFGGKRGDRRRLDEDDHSADGKAERQNTREDTPPTARSRDTTPVSPPDKPLPGLPAAQLITMSPPKQSRTLIDATERPLRVSIGTPNEKEWPVLYPSQPATPHALETFAQLHSVDNNETGGETDADKDHDRMTIKLLTPGGHSEPPSEERTKHQINELEDGIHHLATEPTASDERRPTTSESDSTVKSFPQPKAKLVDIPPRHTSSEQHQKAKFTGKSPNGSIPRYVGTARRENRKPRMKPVPAALQLHDSTRKKSAIPVAAKSPSSSSPTVAHVATPPEVPTTPTVDFSLSTIKDEDTVCMDDAPGANTLMRCGPQRRPTYRESARHQAYSAESVGEGDSDAAMLASHQGPRPPIPTRAPSRKGSVPHRGLRLRESSIFTEHLTVSVPARVDDDEPKDTASKLEDHSLALAQLEGNGTGLVKRFSGKKRASIPSARSSITKPPQVPAVQPTEKNARRSSVSSRPSVNTKAPRVPTTQHSENATRRRSLPSTASFRPPVPAKDSTRHLSHKKPPQGLTRGVSATPSTLPLAKTMDDDSIGPETPTISVTKHKSTTRNKLATGLRGLFHKKSTDLKRGSVAPGSSPAPEMPDTVTTHSKKRMSNLRHNRRTSHLPEKTLPESRPEPEKTPGRSEMIKAADIAMEFADSAQVETNYTRKGQLLSAATALLTAIDCMKQANIAKEKAEQAAREAAMHQELMLESLTTIIRMIGGDGGATTTAASAATLSRSGRRTPKTPMTQVAD
ncbi:hypothetical protein IWZ01DRAFT_574305 [Phyllosticta capitalensis]